MEPIDDYLDRYQMQALTPDAILSGWTSNSLILLTSAMLFFHICQQNSIKIRGSGNKLPAYISISLIVISIVYNFASLRGFQIRITQVMDYCKRDSKCSDEHVNNLNNMKLRNLILGYLLMAIETLVAYLIFFSL